MMHSPLISFHLIVAALAFVPMPRADTASELAAKLEAVMDGPNYRMADWGVLVVDSKNGETLYARNADRLFLPASTTKLYSCAAALAVFGADYRFETPVYARGKIANGILNGDLILVAQGDPTMGGRNTPQGTMAFKDNDHTYAGGTSPCELTDTDPLAGLKDLARQIKSAGVRKVTGDILIDDRLFSRARGSGSGPDILTPMIINDNVFDVLTLPAAEAGKSAIVQVRPQSACLQIDAQVTTVAKGQPTRLEVHITGSRGLVVRGQLAVGHKPVLAMAPMSDPSAWARILFLEALQHEGIEIAASPLQEPTVSLPEREAYSALGRVAAHKSLPFSEVIKVTLKVSHNLYASTLPLLLAAKEGKRTLAEGMRIEGRQLAKLGLDISTVSFAGGAGGANADHVTPRASVQLLRSLSEKPEMKFLFDALPILGVDGTLAESVPSDSPAKGKVFGKTGTLSWNDMLNDRTILTSKALAGVMTTATGRQLTLAIYVNKVPLPKGVPSSREGKTIGKLCELIYLHVP